jgi:uncharacterized membrane-anchored protein YitT (DUF2179 family)
MSKLAALEKVSLKDIAGISLGSLMTAAAIQFIIAPAHLVTGGLSGIAIALHFTTSYPIWLWYIGLNIPIFIAGYKLVSMRFALYSFVGTISLTLFLGLLAPLNIHLGINDHLLAAIFGGALSGCGVGTALVFKGSTGGLDIVAGIVHRLWGVNFGTTLFTTNVIVLLTALVTSNIELTLYSAITMFASATMVNYVTSGCKKKKTVIIVSQEPEAIADTILHGMHRGCTYLLGKGAYTGQDENIIMVTAGKSEIPRLKELIFRRDSKAFLTITDTVEVYGGGFQPWDEADA